MNPLRLLRRLFHGERPADEVAIDPAAAQEYMLLFVRGGGAITFTEWAALPEALRVALAKAHLEYRAETLAALANAIASPAGVVDLLRSVKGGEAAEEAVAGLALASAGARFVAEQIPLAARVAKSAGPGRVGTPGGAP